MSQYTPEYLASVIEERNRRAGVLKKEQEEIETRQKEELERKIPPSVGYAYYPTSDSGGSNPQ